MHQADGDPHARHQHVPPPTRHHEVIDPDVDLHDPSQRDEVRPREWDVLLAVAAGGVLGAESRYLIADAMSHGGRGFPWSTLLINASGCALIAVLMVLVLDVLTPRRLVRPFLGVGVLGGFTTFSTFAVDADRLVHLHRPGTALAYVLATLVVCQLAVHGAAAVMRRAAGVRVGAGSGT